LLLTETAQTPAAGIPKRKKAPSIGHFLRLCRSWPSCCILTASDGNYPIFSGADRSCRYLHAT
jgi:hypothetical protein